MKKLLPVILFCLFLGSCEEEYCWRCEIISSITKEVIKTEEYCDKTEAEIEEMIKEISTASINVKECVRYLN
jgi:hypothetical protein